MTFPSAVERLEDAVFDRLGEDADWEGVGVVRVRRREADENVRLSYGETIARGVTIRVRKSQVPSPAQGATVQLLDPAGLPLVNGLFVINGEPTLDRKGCWTCPAEAAAA